MTLLICTCVGVPKARSSISSPCLKVIIVSTTRPSAKGFRLECDSSCRIRSRARIFSRESRGRKMGPAQAYWSICDSRSIPPGICGSDAQRPSGIRRHAKIGARTRLGHLTLALSGRPQRIKARGRRRIVGALAARRSVWRHGSLERVVRRMTGHDYFACAGLLANGSSRTQVS